MWPIEEKANNGRSSVCINPPSPPMIAFKDAIGRIIYELYLFSLKIHKGAIFCQVDKKKADNQFRLDITEGYQLWKGDIPSFIIIAKKIVISGKELRSGPTKKINEA